MKKRLRLRRWVKVTLNILGGIALAFLLAQIISTGLGKYEPIAKECDEYHGYTCSYYEIEQWSRGIK